ncbi:MAG: aminotransferase class I/II-fold pyridoxal phosphate-dependent enzyme, partial [Pseudomonadota bacterium]
AMVADLINLSTHTTYGVPGYIQDAATYALSMGPTFEDTVALPFRRRRDACLARLDGHPVLRAQAPGGGMYLMLDIRKTGQSAPTFASRLLTTHHIAVMPGDSFGHAAAGHVRVALTLPDAQLMPAFDQILSFAEEIAP